MPIFERMHLKFTNNNAVFSGYLGFAVFYRGIGSSYHIDLKFDLILSILVAGSPGNSLATSSYTSLTPFSGNVSPSINSGSSMVNSDPWAYNSSYDSNHLNLLNASNSPYSLYNSSTNVGNNHYNYNILPQNDGGPSLVNAGLYTGNVRGSPSEYINLNNEELQLLNREYHQSHLNLNDAKPMVNYMTHLSPERYADDGPIMHDKDLNRTSIGGFNIGGGLMEDEQSVKDDSTRVKVEYNMY